MTTPHTTRGRGVRQPLPAAKARTAFDPRPAARARRRRLLLRFVPAVAFLGLLVMGFDKLGVGEPASPAEVARDIRDDVTRKVISRTEDYSATVGPLDCVELQPGRGNCLADVALSGHRHDNTMVAVTYTQQRGGYDILVKLP